MEHKVSSNGLLTLPEGLRIGRSQDESLFRALWAELLEDQLHLGGVSPSEKTLDFFTARLRDYTMWGLPGLLLFGASDNAMLLWGEPPTDYPWSHDLGRWVMAWGIYIRPDFRRKGWGKRMRIFAQEYFKSIGFASSVHGVWPGNEAGRETLLGLGAELYQDTFVLRF